MQNYKTSDLFRRAKQLSDLEGSDFISWNEAENCINESFVGLYEKLINMGDNSFVGSFKTGEKEIELPSDFWQLKGVYLWNDGNLVTINRRADNNSIHHLSYEMRNGKIYVYGNPGEMLIEYYKKPKTLYMPPVDCEIPLDIPEGSEVLACYEHTFVYKTQDTQQNDIICVYDIDSVKNATNIFTTFDTDYIWITKDFVFTLVSDTLYIYDLATGSTQNFSSAIPLVTESNDLFVISGGYINELIYTSDGYALSPLITTEITDVFFCVSSNDFRDVYGLAEGTGMNIIVHNGTVITSADVIFYAKGKCYYLGVNKAGYLEEGENHIIKMGIGEPIGFISINENTGYGYATKKFNKYFVCAYCEDTELNFPNSFYYQILSYLLAISFRCKQGADITLLSNQLEMISQTFEDTLGSDAFQYPRMGNVYN